MDKEKQKNWEYLLEIKCKINNLPNKAGNQ